MVKNNQIVLITGATSGLGLDIAKHYLKLGYKTIVLGKNKKLLKKYYSKNKLAHPVCVDLKKLSLLTNHILKIKKKFKKIDILINNAGIATNSLLESTKDNKIIDVINVNLLAPIIICKQIVKIMKTNNYGRIINISSGGSVNCAPGYLAYSASKSALNTLAKTISKECVGYNIKINTFSPGPCKTKMFPKNPLSTKLCIPYLYKLSKLSLQGPTGDFFWFSKKINIIPKININWKKPNLK
jgi:3-oxoacyl-[acyl-carrier protein] reductase